MTVNIYSQSNMICIPQVDVLGVSTGLHVFITRSENETVNKKGGDR